MTPPSETREGGPRKNAFQTSTTPKFRRIKGEATPPPEERGGGGRTSKEIRINHSAQERGAQVTVVEGEEAGCLVRRERNSKKKAGYYAKPAKDVRRASKERAAS